MRLEVLKQRVNELSKRIYTDISPLPKIQREVCFYQAPQSYSKKIEKGNINIGEVWADSQETAFLSFQGDFSKEYEQVFFDIVLDAEACLFVNGKPYAGIDENHRYIPIPSGFFNYHIEAYNKSKKPLTLRRAHIVSCKVELERFVLLALEAIKVAEVSNLIIAQGIEEMLTEELQLFLPTVADESLEEHAKNALNNVNRALSRYKFNKLPGKLILIPQSHIDLAWLWPEKETVRKLSRTFSTALRLGELCDEFIYHQSQPQFFSYIKEYYPALYQEVKKAVLEGKFELVGGMWVEPDCNIPSGESFVRQLLYGKQFFEKEFGFSPKIEWLPDVFGFSPSLPQILRDADTLAFMTIKLGWNDTNRFPETIFNWRGIDGTTIPVFLPRALNEDVDAQEFIKAMDYSQKTTAVPTVCHLIGFGDGGGGPTLEQIKKGKILSDLPNLPEIEFGSVREYVENNISHKELKNTWDGELYLELHRGTLTTQAKNKKWNRKLELKIRDVEMLSSFSHVLGLSYPKEKIEEAWKLILKNQMHDILPGSSINEVYRDSEADYQYVDDLLEEIKTNSLSFLTQKVSVRQTVLKSYLVFNTMSYKRTTLIKLRNAPEDCHFIDAKGEVLISQKMSDGSCLVQVTLPMLGYITIYAISGQKRFTNEFCISSTKITNNLISIYLGNKGEVKKIIDAQTNEVFVDNKEHHLQFFEDRPLVWDAWELDSDYEEVKWEPDELVSFVVKENGPLCASVLLTWKMHKSTITQELILYRNSRRIDFKTNVDWQETHVLFKTGFDTQIRARYATYDVAFGKYQRPTFQNTSWQKAQFETVGHKWADISDASRGVSLLNDCKYGYDIKGSRIRLSLLRAPMYPDKEADKGSHEFTYSLFLHKDPSLEGTVKEAYDLNVDQLVCEKKEDNSLAILPDVTSFISYTTKGVLLDTIKLAEDNDGFILRFFEFQGGYDTLKINSGVTSLSSVNILEAKKQIKEEDMFVFSPFQIKSYRAKLKM